MASQQDCPALPDDEYLDDEDSPVEDDGVFDDDANSVSTSSSLPPATTPAAPLSVVPSSNPVPLTNTASISTVLATPVPDRLRFDALNDSRKLFQRLWTDEDEIELLQGFLHYTTQRGGGGGVGHQDTSLFYDQIKSKLQLDFNKNQLVEKLRRLKKKFRNAVKKISAGKDVAFKSPHEVATYEISRKIWGSVTASRAVGRSNENFDDDEDHHSTYHVNLNPNPNSVAKADDCHRVNLKKRSRSQLHQVKLEEKNPVSVDVLPMAEVIEEAVRSCVTPMLKEVLSGVQMGGGGMKGAFSCGGSLFPSPLPLSCLGIVGFGCSVGEVEDEKWRNQQILELEVYLKRLELIQEQVKVRIEEVRAAGRR